ncbi:MAG: excinuclease ABC subunit UvrA [Myxococcales bacterium]|nr:excinuclease ABC subunit UvrA [Myxococcales bacterium]
MRSSRASAPDLDVLVVEGARQHNLDVPRLVIPKRALVVFSGPSGSGKSSLAFDTIYAEGQRRYVETLSPYARQFLGQMDRPDVDRIRGLSPTIAIEQKSGSHNPRSTVGTITEVYDYLRLLYARAGTQRCTTCGKEVRARSADEVTREASSTLEGRKVTVRARLVEHRKGEHKDVFEDLQKRGFLRVIVGGEPKRLDGPHPVLKKNEKHTIDLVVDRVTVDASNRARLAEALEVGLREGKGEVLVAVDGEPEPRRFSAHRACCGTSYPELSPQAFSFNGPLGMCPACAGLGVRLEVDPGLVVPNAELSLAGGAIVPWASAMSRKDGWVYRIIEAATKAAKVSHDTPWKKISAAQKRILLYGIDGQKLAVTWGKEGSGSHGTFGVRFEGVVRHLERLFHETKSESQREHYRKFFRERACQACEGKRLRPESLAVELGGTSIADLCRMPVRDAATFVSELVLDARKKKVAEAALVEVRSRLGFLLDVGLDYVSLERKGPTLSGGEAQRIRLASQLGSELSGVMYVLDEPSIGLHPRDNERLVKTLHRLRDLGNSVLVVEHDEDTVRAADHVVDFGPGAGHLGGRVVAEGTAAELEKNPESLTGAYLSGRKRIPLPEARRSWEAALVVRGARENNLKDVTVRFPLGVLTCVTGVSGAGKSSLVGQILLPALSRALHGSDVSVGDHDGIDGLEHVERVVAIDQQPIGRTPRSNPSTYTKAFDHIREIFAQLPDARARGYDAGRFSFNVKGGRCEACQGDGAVKVEMHFLSDVYVPCEVCRGLRYSEATLDVKYRGKSIADVLRTSVDDAIELFSAFPALVRVLRTLSEVGLGYMLLGQPAPTLSGGEAQRVKLSRELGKSQAQRSLYVLDEPTTGLHPDDVRKLLAVLLRLVERGATVIVIEHNLDVVKCADWVVDLGPEGGAGGGQLLAEGTPEAIAAVAGSSTGRFLKGTLAKAAVSPKATKLKKN